jgi:hypothetical protein
MNIEDAIFTVSADYEANIKRVTIVFKTGRKCELTLKSSQTILVTSGKNSIDDYLNANPSAKAIIAAHFNTNSRISHI